MVYHFDLLIIAQLPDIIQEYFSTLDRAMNPTIQMKYAPAVYYVCKRRCCSIKLSWVNIFGAPCKFAISWPSVPPFIIVTPHPISLKEYIGAAIADTPDNNAMCVPTEHV